MTWPPLPRLSPASLRTLLNGPVDGGEALPPIDTPPSPADSHLANLQAANRQLRDDLARAEAALRELSDLAKSVECARSSVFDLTCRDVRPTDWCLGCRIHDLIDRGTDG